MDIRKELDSIVANYDLLKHPFYQAWAEGTLPVRALKTYAEEYGAFVQTVPAGWAGHGDAKTATEEVTHAVLWEQFANALGTTSLKGANLAETQNLVADCETAFSSPATALGGLYAFEAQQPKTATSKLKGLQDHYWELPKEVEPYFAVHCDDVHEMEWIVQRLEGKTDEEKRQALEACEKVAKGLWDTLTAIHGASCQTIN